MAASVFVTDGYWRKTLAVVRALARQGLNVGVGERTPLAPALFSRYAHRRYVYPSVTLRRDDFVQWLYDVAKSNSYGVLITPEEETALVVAQHRAALSKYFAIPIPEYDTIQFVRDKSRLLTYARKIGISCPYTEVVTSFEDIAALAMNRTYPLVSKPAVGAGAQGVFYIQSKTELQTKVKDALKLYGRLLIQEYIPGDKYYGVSVIFNQHNCMRTAFVHQKLRQYPSTGGASTYAVSVKYPKLVELAEALLKSLRWYGVANVEFKIDQRDNVPKLMEANPRLWGSLQLTISSGVNIPHMLYRLALEGDIKPVFDYKTGVKFRWFLHGDAMHFLSNLYKFKKSDPNIFKLYEKGNCHAIWSLSDPLPMIGNILSFLDFLTSKEMKKYRG